MLAAARYEACAIDGAGAIACWGLDADLRPPAHGKYVQIAANWERFCALDDRKRARCFGVIKGQRETTSWHGSDLREIAVGQNHACGLDGRGRVTCWDNALNFGEGILPRNGRTLSADRSDHAAVAREASPSKASPSKAASSSGEGLLPVEPPVDSAFVVEVDGRAVPIVSAVAATAGGEAVSIVLSTRRLTCDATERTWQSVAKNETRIHLTTAALLVEPNQHGDFVRPSLPRKRVTFASWPGGLNVTADGIVTLTSGAAASGARGRLVATYTASFRPAGDAGTSTLSIRGGIAVRGCGDRPPPGVPRLQNDLDVEVAGQRLKVRGAILRRDDDGKPQLLLTSGPASCPRPFSDAPWDYAITVREGSPRQITLEGAKLYAQHLYGSPRIVFDLLPSPAGAAGDAVDVRIDDGGDSRRVPLRIRGIVHAKRCFDIH